MTFCCHGIGISTSRSIAIGKVHHLQRGPLHIQPRWIGQDQIKAEIKRFRAAIAAACIELTSIRDDLPVSTATDIAEFINTHLLMMEDQAITDVAEEIIRQEGCSAEWALQIRRNTLVKVFDEIEDPYLRTRKDDLDHVINRIQKRLLNHQDEAIDDQFKGKIIVARDLTPSDTILMRHQGVIAFITEFGGPMSHTAILARSLNIPAIVGVRHATEVFRQDETIVIDGLNGIAMASPEEAQLIQFRQQLENECDEDDILRQILKTPTISKDGEFFKLMANIELSEDINAALENGAHSIGLYRTEFLYMNCVSTPTEEEHFQSYLEIINKLDGLPITIRTLDLGADKTTSDNQPTSSNPALGLRAIRLCLKETELFKTQLRAIIRASAYGPIKIMLPMLTNTQEIHHSKKLITEIQKELKIQGIKYADNIPIGGMIEVPAAALSAHSFAKNLDFLSIGTNDLIQYTLAIDRVDDEVNYLYDPLHPAILKLIKLSIDAANSAGIPISMCGEMAGDVHFSRLLAGLGLRDFSMQPNSLLHIKKSLLNADFKALKKQTDQMMATIDHDDSHIHANKIAKIIQ